MQSLKSTLKKMKAELALVGIIVFIGFSAS